MSSGYPLDAGRHESNLNSGAPSQGQLSRSTLSRGTVSRFQFWWCHDAYPTGSKMMIRPILAALTVACLSSTALAESCVASRYGGGRTASGERMNASAMTAAHRSRPFGSYVTVTSHSNGRSVTVRINDRGPFVKGRCIDLSYGAARVLGMSGTGMVSLR